MQVLCCVSHFSENFNNSSIKLNINSYLYQTIFQFFLYVSTAYCHLNEKVLHEKAYPPPADPHKVIRAMELLEDELVNMISKK